MPNDFKPGDPVEIIIPRIRAKVERNPRGLPIPSRTSDQGTVVKTVTIEWEGKPTNFHLVKVGKEVLGYFNDSIRKIDPVD